MLCTVRFDLLPSLPYISPPPPTPCLLGKRNAGICQRVFAKKTKKEDSRLQFSYLILQTLTSLKKEMVPIEQFDVISMVDRIFKVFINLWTFFNLVSFVHKLSTFPFCVCVCVKIILLRMPLILETLRGHSGISENRKTSKARVFGKKGNKTQQQNPNQWKTADFNFKVHKQAISKSALDKEKSRQPLGTLHWPKNRKLQSNL